MSSHSLLKIVHISFNVTSRYTNLHCLTKWHLRWGELDMMFIGNCNKDPWLGLCCYACLGFIMQVSILIALAMRLWRKPHYNLISWITRQKGTNTSCVKSLTFINVRSAQGMGFNTLFNWLLMWPQQGDWGGTGIWNPIIPVVHNCLWRKWTDPLSHVFLGFSTSVSSE